MGEKKATTVCGKINGKNIYRRVAIRRRRYPICEDEILKLQNYQLAYGISDEELGIKGCDISNMGEYVFAGKIFSYLDIKSELENPNFVAKWENVEEQPTCSNCGYKTVYDGDTGRWFFSNFCPMCGAEMKNNDLA